MNQVELKGRCACGAVRFHLKTTPIEVIVCHCETCRRWSGHYWAATHVRRDALVIDAGETLTWWASSDIAERGFCARCGSGLFYRQHGVDRVSVAPGALDKPTSLAITAHIFCAEAGDYYRIYPSARRYAADETG